MKDIYFDFNSTSLAKFEISSKSKQIKDIEKPQYRKKKSHTEKSKVN